MANNKFPELVVSKISEEVMREFMPIFQERLRGNIKDFHIGHEGDLDDSFRTRLTKKSNGAIGTIAFNFYGRFVDMGVGKGLTLAELQNGRQYNNERKGLTSKRKPKVWFSSQYSYERQRLLEIMTERMQVLAAQTAAQIDDEIVINI